MVDILVRPAELRQISEQLRSSAKKIGMALQAIDNDILSLKGDQFLGNRANSVQAHYAPKRESLFKAKDIVAHFAEDLQAAAARFERADNENSIPSPSQSSPITLGWKEDWVTIGSMILTGEFGLEWDYETKFNVEKMEFQKWWNKLDDWQRQDFLKEQAKEIAKEYGIPRDEIKIEYIDGAGKTLGQHNGDTIKIDIDDYKSSSPSDILKTLAHEVRHSIQEVFINKYDGKNNIPGGVTQDQINNWKNSLGDNYVKPEDDVEKYFTQSCESDARMFSLKYLSKYLQDKVWEYTPVLMPDSTPIPDNAA
jgi:uncharacterized protein YukE